MVWIEIEEALSYLEDMTVTTCVVVWIEIPVVDNKSLAMASPPAWWCGLKFPFRLPFLRLSRVTTCVVVWIEIFRYGLFKDFEEVTTCVVVWIEILIRYI